MATLELDTGNIGRFLASTHKKQLPFAIMQSLNDIAFDTRGKQTEQLPNRLSLSTKGERFFKSQIRVDKATKSNLISKTGYSDKVTLGTLLESGGTRKPNKKVILRASNELKRGKPLTRAKFYTAVKTKGAGSKRPFVATMKSGKQGLFIRKTKKRLPIKLLYAFDRSQTYKDNQLGLEDTANLQAKRMGEVFEKRLLRAIANAK